MTQKKYFFVLGRNPGLSLLEVDAALSSVVSLITSSYDIALANGSINNPREILSHLGGTIKIGVCELELDSMSLSSDAFAHIVTDWIEQKQTANKKLTLGLSVYSLARRAKLTYGPNDIHRAGIAVKKQLRESGYSVRVVLPQKGLTLTSVQVDKNGLLDNAGKEVVVIVDGKKMLIGITQAVQEFEAYSFRDWERPSKEAARGLLPPKLAQIMINLAVRGAKKDARILDPFCGSGTVLQEALLIGYSNFAASDIDPTAVANAKKNLEWLSTAYGTQANLGNIILADATRLQDAYQASSFDAIITEPYLGPLYKKPPTEDAILKTIQELMPLYRSFLKGARHVLEKDGRICMVWPVWMLHDNPVFLPLESGLGDLGFLNTTIPHNFPFSIPERTERGTLLIRRPDSIVARELIVLKLQ